jgi:hypothetical protein
MPRWESAAPLQLDVPASMRLQVSSDSTYRLVRRSISVSSKATRDDDSIRDMEVSSDAEAGLTVRWAVTIMRLANLPMEGIDFWSSHGGAEQRGMVVQASTSSLRDWRCLQFLPRYAARSKCNARGRVAGPICVDGRPRSYVCG